MENGGGLFVKKVESVGVFGKKVDLSSTQSALCTVSVFFCFAFYLLRGVYAPNTPPPYGPEHTDGHRERFRVVPAVMPTRPGVRCMLQRVQNQMSYK